MRANRSTLLACLALAVACAGGTDGTGDPTGNTELNLNIVDPGGTSGELGFSIDRVDYRITCAGNPTGSYPIPDADTAGTDYAYDDSVDISGAFEVVDTRNPPVWQAVMDLPPGDCTITLSVYEDDEIVCVGTQTLAINEDATTKYDIVLVCSLSVDLPDGMADVDGTFEFITGNLCPKLYVLNAIPSTIIQDSSNPIAQTEIQYRAKDPDDTCGANCDPQTCDFSNPPVCSPYPSNINDPACNPAAGGDPNSVDCQAGVYAGLVCTISAWPIFNPPGVPGGTFISPLDGVTPVGPVLPVNLNLASGLPGIILPGLGGPAGTNAANSPAYPPLPNVNGSLPALLYQCDITRTGPILINLDCSDGDADCDQNKQFIVECANAPHYCLSDPIDCSGSGECLSDGLCDNFCDPLDSCNRCPGQDNPVPDGTACTEGGGSECLAGACVECVNDSACLSVLPPADCQLDPTCVGNSCQAGAVAPSGTPCSNGLCDGTGTGACQFTICDPCEQNCLQSPQACTQALTMGCTNNLMSDISIIPFQLDVNPGPVLTGTVVPVTFGGEAQLSEFFLDAIQGVVFGGLTEVILIDLTATTLIRTGGAGGSVVLTNTSVPAICTVSGAACDPVNDLPSVPGVSPNTDCVPVGAPNYCQRLVPIPTSSDCSVGGECDLIGKGPGTAQCDNNGFCVTGPLPLPFADQTTTFTPAASGTADFGFDDQNTGVTLNPNGTYNLPGAVFGGLSTPNQLEVRLGLTLALRCTMAVDSGGPLGVGVPDQSSPTPTSELLRFNIQIP